MTLVEHNEHHLVFALSDEQRMLLEHTLRRYPVDFTEDPISRFGDPDDLAEETEMLREAIAETRAENSRNIRNFLREPGRLKDTDDGCHLLLQRTKINWLLEVLNEIRVGYWHLLGRPALEEYRADAAPEIADKVFMMQLCGWFQMALLEALEEAASDER